MEKLYVDTCSNIVVMFNNGKRHASKWVWLPRHAPQSSAIAYGEGELRVNTKTGAAKLSIEYNENHVIEVTEREPSDLTVDAFMAYLTNHGDELSKLSGEYIAASDAVAELAQRPRKFETVYRKAVNGYNPQNPDNHVAIYIRFIWLCQSNFKDMPPEPIINVWHIEQNMHKPKNQGGRSIREICAGEFSTFEAMYA